MEILLELIGQFLLELIGQLIFELLIEAVIRGIGQGGGIEERKDPFLATLGYAVLAGLGGFVSVLVFPKHFIHNQLLRRVNLILTPCLVGLAMVLRGHQLEMKGKATIRLDSFTCGFLFALIFATIRHWFAH